MKYIKEFQEGDKIHGTYLVKNVVKGKTTSAKDYLSINLQDKTSDIDGKLWKVDKELLDTIKAGDFINVGGNVIEYRDALQLKLEQVEIVDADSVDISDYIQTAPINKEQSQALLHEFVNDISDPIVKQVIVEVLKKYRDDLYDFPAASKNHHAYHSGLVYHVVSMLKLARALYTLYPVINTNYLYAGIILHDLGKIEELSGVIATEYTTKGKLLGHISIIHSELLSIAKELGYQDSEQVMILEHMVLSHHGKLEYGSPVLPMTREAELINYIDNIDARMDTLNHVYDKVEPGKFSPKVFALENRSFYKYKEENK